MDLLKPELQKKGSKEFKDTGKGDAEQEAFEYIMMPKKKRGQKLCQQLANEEEGEEEDEEGQEFVNDVKKLPRTLSKAVDLSRPAVEVEVWLRSVPLEVEFSPPFIIATGNVNSRLER